MFNYAVVNVRKEHSANLGDHSMGDPPVLIPNTVVKPHRAESTWLDTAREDMLSPDTKKALLEITVLFPYIIYIDILFSRLCLTFISSFI